MPPDLASWLTLSGSNYPCLDQFSMVPKMLEPLKFDCFPSRAFKKPWIRHTPAVKISIRVSNLYQLSRQPFLVSHFDFSPFSYSCFVDQHHRALTNVSKSDTRSSLDNWCYSWNLDERSLLDNSHPSYNSHFSCSIFSFVIQSNLNSSNTDGSFTMANSNSFLSPYENLPITQERKYLGKFSYFIMKSYVVCTH